MRITARRAAATLAALVAFGIALSGCSADGQVRGVALPDQVDAALPDDTVAQMQAAVDQAMQATGSTGAIVGVWVPWSGSWVTAHGTTRPQGAGEPVATDMSFRVGDVTRAMTCDVLYDLAADDVVDLNDSITEYVSSVPNLADDPGDITLQQLCDSTSGLGSSWDAIAGSFYTTPDRHWHPREIASYGITQDRTTPGAAFRDSDAGYLLLGEALERATGTSAAALLREHIFTPNDLGHTALPAPAVLTPGVSEPYLPGYQSWSTDIEAGCVAPTEYTEGSSSRGFTDSGVVSTITDLGRYGQVLAAKALAEQDNGRFDHNLPVDPSKDSWFTYGGGAYQAGSLLGQQGRVPGYSTSVWADPATGMAVAVVLNNSAGGETIAGLLGRELAAIASKTPAAEGRTQPEFGLPWTPEAVHQQIADAAVCPVGE